MVGGAQDEYEALVSGHDQIEPAVDVDEADLALLIYSSGTTGRPKGVMVSQKALMAHTVNVGSAFPFAAGDVNLVAMPLFHVGGT